jgi:hypothetical protein
VPTIAGLMLICYQAYLYYTYGLDAALDNISNGVFGIFVSIWSSFFIESWKKVQTKIQFFWALDSQTVDKDDERTEVFKYSMVYNEITYDKEKKKVEPPKATVRYYQIGGIGALIIIIALTVSYFLIDGWLNAKLSE